MFNPSIGNYQLSFYRELVNIKLKIAVLNIFRYIFIGWFGLVFGFLKLHTKLLIFLTSL